MMRYIIFSGIIGLIVVGCVPGLTPISEESQSREATPTLVFADSLWGLRADLVLAQQALDTYSELARNDSTALETWSRLSHVYYYCANFLEDTPIRRDSLYLKGSEVSQQFLAQDHDYKQLLFSTGVKNLAIQGLDAQYLDLMYWGMANLGKWLSTKGTLVRLGQRNLMWTTLEHIHDLDSTYYYGAYYRYKGALLSRDPETQSDTLAIREAFETAIEIAPDYLGNYTLMAMYYCPLINDQDQFYRLLTTVVTADNPRTLPYYPENLHEKDLAERLMITAENEGWFK